MSPGDLIVLKHNEARSAVPLVRIFTETEARDYVNPNNLSISFITQGSLAVLLEKHVKFPGARSSSDFGSFHKILLSIGIRYVHPSFVYEETS